MWTWITVLMFVILDKAHSKHAYRTNACLGFNIHCLPPGLLWNWALLTTATGKREMKAKKIVLCAIFYRIFLIFPLFSFKYDLSILSCPGILLVTCKESKFKGYKKGIKKRNYVGNDYSFRVSAFLNWITLHLELLELQTSLETNLGFMINCILYSKNFCLLFIVKDIR